ncbi:MAG: hypothetical protein WCC48_09385 [Anaeromyxobacteraceae bacterium]
MNARQDARSPLYGMLDTRLRRQKPPPANSRQRPNVGVYGGCGFLHRDFGLSKGASHFRKVAAELIQRYPEVVDPLRDGRLCITSVVELARVITPENRSDVLPRFFHASKQEAKAVAAEILPAVVVPRREMVTTVPVPAARAMVLPGATMGAPVSEPAAVRQDGAEVLPVEPQPSLPPRPAPPTSVQPLTAEARRGRRPSGPPRRSKPCRERVNVVELKPVGPIRAGPAAADACRVALTPVVGT